MIAIFRILYSFYRKYHIVIIDSAPDKSIQGNVFLPIRQMYTYYITHLLKPRHTRNRSLPELKSNLSRFRQQSFP